MSKDIMDELTSKLGGHMKQRKPYQDIIKELRSMGLNEHQLQKKLNEEIEKLSKEAQGLEGNSKYKDAAILYYECGIIVKELSDSESTAHLSWIKKSSNSLVSLANEYITWKEVDKAAASISIANLIYFLTGEWTLLSAYNEFNEKYKDLIQQGKTASQSLWVAYDLVTSVNQLNAESLQRAESYAQMALLTQTEPTKTFHDAVQTVLTKAREAMTSKMKLPNLEISGLLPKDIVFGENFKLEMEIRNSGEGFAHDVTITFEKIDGLVLTQGQTYSVYFQELEANSKMEKFELEFNCPSGEGEKERTFEIKGKAEFLDVLENKRLNPIGPYPITIRAFKKADELKESLTKIESSHSGLLEQYESFISSTEASQSLINSFKGTFKSLKDSITQSIKDGEYVKAETRISLLNTFLDSMGSPAAKVILEHDETVTSLEKTREHVISASKTTKDNISKIEVLISDLETKWKK